MPSDPVTLDDLRVVCPKCRGAGEVMVDSASMVGIPGGWLPDQCPDCSSVGLSQKPATLDDFTQAFSGLSADEQVQVLEGMGAKRQTTGLIGVGLSGPLLYVLDVNDPGTYLVLPLPTPQEERLARCDHNWVSAQNSIIESGEFCTKCHAIRAEEKTTPTETTKGKETTNP